MRGRHARLGAIALWIVWWASASALGQPATPPAWPHAITTPAGSVVVYQPQAISWPDHKTLTARAAVAITPQGHPKSVLGTIELSLATHTDEAAGMVMLSDPTLLATHFPSLDTAQATALEAKIRTALTSVQIRPEPLQSILLSLNQLPVANVAVSNDPPAVYYESSPASLVIFDGEPVMTPVGNTGLAVAVNTNWDVFTDNGAWYLLNNGVWFRAPAPTGPYTAMAKLPAAFAALPNDANFAEVRKHVPARPPPPAAQLPTIVVSTKPAEIIVTSGPPQLAAIPGTTLQRVSNTPSTLIFAPAAKQFYLLISGRWFSALALNGPWTFASDRLPSDFALIPDTAKDSHVLASVPGSVQAQEAVLKAQIPATATLKRSAATLTVTYAGPPRFQPIPGTQIEYAVNTASQILKIGAKYYACENGAWFVASGPSGPWLLADSMPPEIKKIPPSSPVYNVSYVQVYGATPATVTYGYTAGYLMGYVTAGVLVYGTGYYYPPVVVPGPRPIYYPYPYTYASNVWYNPSTGAWARGGTVYGPYGGAATGGRYYNPSTGGWAQGGAIYGPYGGAGAWSYYNPRTGTYARGSAAWGNGSGTANANFYNPRYGVSGSTNQNVNPYGRWGSSTFTGPNQTVNTQSRGNANGAAGSFTSSSGAKGAGYYNRATGSAGGAVKGANGDVYAGRDGNVYRHDDNGWSKWNNGGWNPVQPQSTNRNGGGSSGNLGTSRTGGRSNTLDSSSYRQLQQDRLGRQAGNGEFRGRGAGGSRRFLR
jgi:hypothetical protein